MQTFFLLYYHYSRKESTKHIEKRVTEIRVRVFSERELEFMFATPSVCRLSSVTFVRPTQTIEIFGNVSTP